jgi:uncharacterized membrane protein YdcZ (DUF606 family)
MFNVVSEINWFAVLAASVAMTVLGGIWFAGLFKKQYPIALGRTDLGDQKPSPLFIAGPFVCGAVVVITNAIMIRALGITTYGDALIFGAITGVGYLTAQTVNIAINPNFPRPFFYSLINGPYFIVGNLIACAILVAMA